MKILKLITAVALLSLATACAGGAAGEKDTPIADIQAKAADADQAQLEASVADYESVIKEQGKQREAALAKAAEALGEISISDMLGEEGKAAKQLAGNFEDEAKAIMKDIKALQERLAVYASELEKRNKGS